MPKPGIPAMPAMMLPTGLLIIPDLPGRNIASPVVTPDFIWLREFDAL